MHTKFVFSNLASNSLKISSRCSKPYLMANGDCELTYKRPNIFVEILCHKEKKSQLSMSNNTIIEMGTTFNDSQR